MNYKKLTDTISELTITDGTEHAEIYLLQLFPGIILGINYVNIHRITGDTAEAASLNILRINYCFEGRCEVKLTDGRYVYVDNNALCIEDHEPQYNFHYPLGFYRGIQIFIDKDVVKNKCPDALDLFGIRLLDIIDKYSSSNQTFIQIASRQFAQKSAEIMTIWEAEDLTYESKVSQIRLLLCHLFFILQTIQQ